MSEDPSRHDNDSSPPSAKEVREKLRHFSKMEEEETEEFKKSSFAQISEFFEGLMRSKKPEQKKPAATANAMKALSAHPKRIAAVAGAVVVLLLAVFVLPIIPLQLKRSSAFAAIEAGNYQAAYDDLDAYLSERPNDSEAAQKMAHAAIRVGNIRRAKSALASLGRKGGVANSPEFLYDLAIVNLDNPQAALPALDKMLSQRADHVAALLLRGLLLSGDKQSFRKAREDMLRADETIRNSGANSQDVAFLRTHLLRNNLMLFPFAAAIDGAPPGNSPPSKLWGFDTGWDGYINRTQSSAGEAFVNEQLPVKTVAKLYFADVLMRQGKLDEAENEIRDAINESPDSPSVKQAQALLYARRGDNADAAKLFAELAEETNDAQTFSNLAAAAWAASPILANVGEVADAYADSLNSRKDDPTAFNNAVYFYLLQENTNAAEKLLTTPPAGVDSPQLHINRATFDALRGEGDIALRSLSSVPVAAVARLPLYVAAIRARQGKFDEAAAILRNAEQANPADAEAPLFLARLLLQQQDWWMARDQLSNFLQRQENDEARYLLAKAALALADEVEFKKQIKVLEDSDSPDTKHWLYAAQAGGLVRAGDFASADANYRQAIDAAPLVRDKQEYAKDWAILNIRTGNDEEVADFLSPILAEQFNPELSALLSYVRAAETGDAGEGAFAAIAAAHSPTTQSFLGAALAKSGEVDDAIPLLMKALQQLPTDVFLLKSLQEAQQKAGLDQNAETTEKILDYLAAIGEGNAPIEKVVYQITVPDINSLAQKLQKAIAAPGNAATVKEALDGYEIAVQNADKTDDRARLLMSRATFRVYLEQFEDAAADFQAALDMGLSGQARQDALLFYVRVLRRLELNSKASEVLEQLVSLSPDIPLYRRMWALSLVGGGDENGAVRVLQSLIKNYPDDIEGYYQLAKLMFRREKYGEATQLLRTLTRIAPNFAGAYELLATVYAVQENKEREQLYSRIYSTLLSNQ